HASARRPHIASPTLSAATTWRVGGDAPLAAHHHRRRARRLRRARGALPDRAAAAAAAARAAAHLRGGAAVPERGRLPPHRRARPYAPRIRGAARGGDPIHA